LWKNIRR